MSNREREICQGYDRDGNTSICPDRRAKYLALWTKEAAEKLGLGDQVSALLQSAGLQECGGCKERKTKLNAAAPASHWLTRLVRRVLPKKRQASLTLPSLSFSRWQISTADCQPSGLAKTNADAFPVVSPVHPFAEFPAKSVTDLTPVKFRPGRKVCPVFTADNEPVPALRDSWKGATVFLCCGGPSLAQLDLSLLQQRGIMIAAVNQVAATHVRPHVAITVDKTARFHSSIWSDSAILKIARYQTRDDRIAERHGDDWKATGPAARDCPSTLFYKASTGFDAATFLKAGSVVWGGTTKLHGRQRETRNVMLAALRLLYWLGARRVVLLGCDFHMQPGQSYAFEDPKNSSAAGYNNNTYSILDQWFHELQPHFQAAGYHVCNATPGSHLTAFDQVEYLDAVNAATAQITPATPDSVTGLYQL